MIPNYSCHLACLFLWTPLTHWIKVICVTMGYCRNNECDFWGWRTKPSPQCRYTENWEWDRNKGEKNLASQSPPKYKVTQKEFEADGTLKVITAQQNPRPAKFLTQTASRKSRPNIRHKYPQYLLHYTHWPALNQKQLARW